MLGLRKNSKHPAGITACCSLLHKTASRQHAETSGLLHISSSTLRTSERSKGRGCPRKATRVLFLGGARAGALRRAVAAFQALQQGQEQGEEGEICRGAMDRDAMGCWRNQGAMGGKKSSCVEQKARGTGVLGRGGRQP